MPSSDSRGARSAALAATLVFLIAIGSGARAERASAEAGQPDSAGQPDRAGDCPSRERLAAAALVYLPRGRTVDLWFAPLTGQAPSRAAWVARAADTPVTGVSIPGTNQVAIVVTPRAARDITWTGALYLAQPGQAPRLLLDRVHAGGVPVAAAGGPVFVVRGARRPEREPADRNRGFRRDRLEIVAVDLQRGGARVIHGETGDALFLLGLLDRELYVYRVGVRSPAGRAAPEAGASPPGEPTDLVAIDVATGAIRSVLAPAPPLARDFSIDADRRTLWLTALRSDAGSASAAEQKAGAGRWAVEAVDLATGRFTTVVTADSMGLTPHAWPGGRVAFRCTGGLCFGAAAGGPIQTTAPLGPGAYQIHKVGCTAEGPVALGHHDGGGPFPIPFLEDVAKQTARNLALPRARVVFAGLSIEGR